MTIENQKIRTSMQGKGKRDEGLKMKPEFKKRGSDHFGKDIKRLRSIKEDWRMVLPVIGCDCKKKFSSKQRNPGRSDYHNSTPPLILDLHNEKERNCRSHHSSSSPTTATIHEGCTITTTLLSPTKALRAAQIKKRYAHLIFKANHHPLNEEDNYNADPLKQQQERERLEIAEKVMIDEEIKAAQTLLRMRAKAELKIQREAARIALEKMEKTVEFNDALQIMRDYESLLNVTVC